MKLLSMTATVRQLLLHFVWGAVASSALGQTPPAPSVTATYAYDEAGNKTSQTDALGRVTSWTFDALGRVTSKTLPAGSRESSSYDSEGNLLRWTRAAGEAISYQYDVNDYPVGQVIAAGAGSNAGVPAASIVSQFNALGLLVSSQEQGPTTLDGLQSYRYDVNDRLLAATSPIGQISYAHDPLGTVLERSVAGAGTVRYQSGPAGRLTQVTAADGRQVRHSYDASGRLYLTERDLNAQGGDTPFIRTSLNWDQADRLVEVAHVRISGSAARFLAGQKIERGPGGHVTRIATIRGNGTTGTTSSFSAVTTMVQEFEYDSLARLVKEVRSHVAGTTTIGYAYDAVGNRSRKTVTSTGGTDETTYSYDANDRLTEERTSLAASGTRLVTYSWDGNGNLARKAEAGRVTLYRFDPRNKLIDIRTGETRAAAEAAVPSVRYAYDANGHRVRKWVGDQVTHYLIDINQDHAQLVRESTGTDTVDYVRGVGLIRQIRKTGGITKDLYPLAGHLSTSLGAADADGEVIEQVDSDAFGNPDRAGSLQTHLYTGEYWDQDSQLLYLRARWYDPKIGRFVSADPYEGRVTDPQSLHRYAYAHSDPVQNTDPSGTVATATDVLGGVNFQAISRVEALGQRVQTAMSQLRSACDATRNVFSAMHRHHARPKFTGGQRKWDDEYILRMEQIVHDRLHVLLDLALQANRFMGRSEKRFGLSSSQYYEKLYRRLPSAEPAVFAVIEDIAEVFDYVCKDVPGVKGSLKEKVRNLR